MKVRMHERMRYTLPSVRSTPYEFALCPTMVTVVMYGTQSRMKITSDRVMVRPKLGLLSRQVMRFDLRALLLLMSQTAFSAEITILPVVA